MRRPRRAGDKRGQIVDLVSISKRPATVEDRAVPGHWEGDLLSGSKNSYIATLVERQARYVTLAKVANKDTQTVVSAVIKQAKTIPNELYKLLTWDRGKELAARRRAHVRRSGLVAIASRASSGMSKSGCGLQRSRAGQARAAARCEPVRPPTLKARSLPCDRHDRVPGLMPTMAAVHHKERPARIVSGPSRPPQLWVHAVQFQNDITPQSASL